MKAPVEIANDTIYGYQLVLEQRRKAQPGQATFALRAVEITQVPRPGAPSVVKAGAWPVKGPVLGHREVPEAKPSPWGQHPN